MEKHLLRFLLVTCLLFLGVKTANAAQTITVTNNTTSIAANPLISQLNAVVDEITVSSTGSATANVKTMTFTATTNPSLEAGSITLYTYTNATFPGIANATPLETITSPTTTMAFTFTIQPIASGSTQYFFLVENFSRPTTNGAIQFSWSTANNAAGNLNVPALAVAGTAYTWVPAVSVTYTAYNTPGSNGLPAATPPISTTQATPVIYGFSLLGGAATGGATATAINQLTFTDGGTTGGANSNFFTNIALYSSTSSIFPGAGNTGATLIQSVAANATTVATFTGLNLVVSPGTTTYYFVVVTPSFQVTAVSDYQLNYTSNSGTMSITAGNANKGYDYTISPPTYTIATNTSGISTGPYYYGTTGNVLESFGVSTTSTGTFTDFTLKSTVAYTSYFSNLTIYSSSNPNYAADLAGTGSPLTSVAFTTTGTTTLAVTLSTAQGIGTTPIYYFVVADFTAGDNLLPATFQFQLTAADANSGGSPMAATNTFPITYTNYSLKSPIIFGGPYTGGLATANQLNYNQTQVGILGFSITTPIPETISSLNFSANITPFSDVISSFFSNVKIYSNTTNTAVGATLITGATVSSLNGTTFTISGLNQVINNTTVYYFIEADFTAPTNFSATFQLGVTSATNTSSLVCNDGAPINGTIYNISPSIVLGTATATGLAANPIIASQNGSTLAIFGFSVYTGPANTFNTFKLYSTQPAGQYLGTNFSGYALYYNTTNSLTGAALVPGATFSSIAASDTLTISGFSQLIGAGNTYYYFIKAVFASPAIATTYQLNLLSVTNTASKTYTTGGPINGINYTLAGPLGVYYWEATVNRFGIVTSYNWENANNWLNANTGSTGNGYPGQSANNDIAVFSGTYIKYNLVTVASSHTISQMLVSINNTYSMIVELSNAITFTVTNNFTLGDPGLTDPQPPPMNPANIVRSQLILGEVNTNGTGQYFLSGTASIYNDGSLAMDGPATFSSGSTLNLYGTTNDPAFFGIYSATVTANNVTWNLTGNGSAIYVDNTTTSILNATGSRVNFTGFSSQISSYGYPTFTGCTFNSSTISNNNYLSGIGTSAGTTTITGSSVVNLGTTSSNGNFNELQNTGGTFNVSGSSVVNMRGPSAYIYNDYTATNIGTVNAPVYTPQAYFNINSATVNMGTSGGSDGSGVEIYNTDNAFFNLNGGAIVNMNGANTEIYNTSGLNYSKATGLGVFQAASTSVINPTSTTALVTNDNASNYFTLLSDINGAATIGQLGTGAMLAGQYNVQRYLNGGSLYLRNYRMLSSPVNTDAATSNASNHIDLTYLGATATIPNTATTFYGAFIGGPGSGFGGTGHTFANPLMYLYQENVVPGADYNKSFLSGKNVGIMSLNTTNHTIGTSNTADGYGSGSPATAPSVVSTAIPKPAYDSSTGVSVPPGNGYIMYYVGNSQDATPSSATAPTTSNITASGYINQSQVQLYMWGSGSGYLTDTYGLPGVRLPGITVVGNPYPSTLDLEQVWFDNSHAISTTLYQLDKTNQQFDTYNASTHVSSTAQSSEYVASGQGFYIHVDSLGTTHNFYFQEDQKTPSTTSPFFPPISNFAVIPHSGVITDNVSAGTTGNNASAGANIDDVNNTVAPAEAQQNDSDGSRVNNVPLLSLASIQQVNSETATLPFGIIDSVVARVALAKAPLHLKRASRHGFGKEEAKQPKQTPPKPGIANPATLHLKFVVDSTDYDEVAVCFNKAWSDKYDKDDSFDLDGQAGKVYLSSYTSDDVRTSINALGDYKQGKRIKLYVKSSTAGIFQLQMTDIANFNTRQYSVFLLDKMLNDSLDLTLYKSYNFNYAPGTANDSTRFVLAIEHKPIPHYALLNFAGQKVTPGVQLNWKTTNEGNITTFVLQKLSANNTYVFLDSLQSDSSGNYSYVDQHPTLGNNTYRLQQTDGLGNITYSVPVTIGYNSTSPNGDLTLYPNPAKTTMTVTLATSSTATTVATADIYNTSGKLIEHKVVNSNSFVHDVSAYDLGAYIIELKNSQGLIVGKSKFVKVQ